MTDPATLQPSIGARAFNGMVAGIRRGLWVVGWPVRMLLLAVIAVYRATLSGVLGGHCRFEPSCSVYAAQAIRARGAAVGGGLALWRIARCNPFARGGSDPAPIRPTYENVIQGKPA